MERKLGPEFESCVKAGRIRRFSPGPTFVAGELAAVGQDLDEARRTLAAGGLKWATIQAYYSMFHSARALLYAKGYRERSHRCLVIGQIRDSPLFGDAPGRRASVFFSPAVPSS